MDTNTWTDGPFLGFDTETTGVNPAEDRVVTAALVLRDSSGTRERTWLLNPGVPIPEGAAAIHGITTEVAEAEGQDPAEALEEVATFLTAAQKSGIPIVAFNAGFDLAILDADLTRHGLATLPQRLGRAARPVIDPLVLDRGLDRYRRGKRTLGHLCEVYGVAPESLHTAEVDVAATLDVLAAIASAYPQIGQMSLAELHEYQVKAHHAWATNFNEWLSSKNRAANVGTAWPF